jgi:opacity protein-like surface antigen
MMNKFLAVITLALLSVPMFAQEGAPPKAEIFGGYQYTHIGSSSDLGTTSGQGFNGWDANATYNFAKFLGVEGDFSGAYTSISGVSTHIYTYTGGPVIGVELAKIHPFAHVLFGGTDLTGSQSGASVSWNGFTTMVGGGVDYKLSGPLAFRVAQFDWLYYHYGSKTISGVSFPSFSGSNNVRISTGVVVRF